MSWEGWFNLDRLFRRKRKIIVIVLAFLIILVAPRILMSMSYVTAYQGAKSSYRGIYYAENGQYYTSREKHNASLCQFNSLMKFDVDEARKHKPNLVGELTAVQIPLGESGWIPPDWVPSSWWRDAQGWTNPQETYEWRISNDDGSTSQYHMENWRTKWFFSISAEWDSGPNIFSDEDEAQSRRYKNVDVWFQFDISPTWYFEGTDLTYFAIAKIELTHIKFNAKAADGTELDASKTVRVLPMSAGSVLTIYTSMFGNTQTESETEIKSFYYQNITLNPLYFRDKVYTYVSLLDFGTTEWWRTFLVELKAKGDVVTMGFTVTQFCVGEWRVKDIGDIPDEYGRTPKVQVVGWTGIGDFFVWLAKTLASPWTWLFGGSFVLLAIGVIVFIILIYFFGLPRFLRRKG